MTEAKTRTRRKQNSYDASNIKVFKGTEAARKRINMYLGERGDQMVYRAIKEFLDNSCDEALAGRNTTTELFADVENDFYIVADMAGGIPVEKNVETGKSTLDVVFTELHGGGKFDDKAYSNSIGINGLGAAVANAVAKELNVYTKRKNIVYHRTYREGKPIGNIKKLKTFPQSVVSKLQKSAKEYGTIITFVPDQTIVSIDATNNRIKNKEIAKLPVVETAKWMQMIALMNPGIIMRISTPKGKKVFHNKKDISVFVDKIVEENELGVIGKPFVFQSDGLDCSIQWTSDDTTHFFKSYVNCSPTIDKGKHVDGFMSAMTKALNKFKGKRDSFKVADAVVGMVGVLNWKMSQPEFSSQTKDKLTSNVNKEVEALLLPELEKYLESNKSMTQQILKRANTISKGRDELKKIMKSVSDVKRSGRNMLPINLIVAQGAKPHEREIYLTEGNSAGENAKKARDANFQEIFKLKGKPANAEKTDIGTLLKSQVIRDMLVTFGVNLNSLDLEKDNSDIKFSTEGMRVGNVMILTDADTDGSHIAVLLLTAIQKLLPDLYTQGRVYIVKTPLFLARHRDVRYYGDSLEEVRKKLPENATNVHITRAKGLGELNFRDLHETAFNPAKRKLIKVCPPKDANGMAYFEAITGKSSQPRKELLGIK